jgi:hypothetical protein
VTILPVQAWRLGEWKSDNFTRRSWWLEERKGDYFNSAFLEVWGVVEKRQFYQCKLGGWGSVKVTILPVRAWRLGEQKKRQFYQCELGGWGSGNSHILPVEAWRLGEWKGDNFTSAFVEVWGAKKRQFYQCDL